MYIKHDGDAYPCCQSYMLDGAPVGNVGTQSLDQIWNGEPMQNMRRLHTSKRAGEIDVCAKCCTTIPHPALVAGSLLLHGRDGPDPASLGGAAGLFLQAPAAAPEPAEDFPVRKAIWSRFKPRRSDSWPAQGCSGDCLRAENSPPFRIHSYQGMPTATHALTREQELHWLALRMTPGLGTRSAGQLIQKLRTPETIYFARLQQNWKVTDFPEA